MMTNTLENKVKTVAGKIETTANRLVKNIKNKALPYIVAGSTLLNPLPSNYSTANADETTPPSEPQVVFSMECENSIGTKQRRIRASGDKFLVIKTYVRGENIKGIEWQIKADPRVSLFGIQQPRFGDSKSYVTKYYNSEVEDLFATFNSEMNPLKNYGSETNNARESLSGPVSSLEPAPVAVFGYDLGPVPENELIKFDIINTKAYDNDGNVLSSIGDPLEIRAVSRKVYEAPAYGTPYMAITKMKEDRGFNIFTFLSSKPYSIQALVNYPEQTYPSSWQDIYFCTDPDPYQSEMMQKNIFPASSVWFSNSYGTLKPTSVLFRMNFYDSAQASKITPTSLNSTIINSPIKAQSTKNP